MLMSCSSMDSDTHVDNQAATVLSKPGFSTIGQVPCEFSCIVTHFLIGMKLHILRMAF